MVQRAGGSRLLNEAPPPQAVGDFVRRQNLDGDPTGQPRVATLVNDAHGAASDLADDLVVPKLLVHRDSRSSILRCVNRQVRQRSRRPRRCWRALARRANTTMYRPFRGRSVHGWVLVALPGRLPSL